jgi:hypothetical protein
MHVVKYLQTFGANVLLTHQTEPGVRSAVGYFFTTQRRIGSTAVFNNMPLAGDLQENRILLVHWLIVA